MITFHTRLFEEKRFVSEAENVKIVVFSLNKRNLLRRHQVVRRPAFFLRLLLGSIECEMALSTLSATHT